MLLKLGSQNRLLWTLVLSPSVHTTTLSYLLASKLLILGTYCAGSALCDTGALVQGHKQAASRSAAARQKAPQTSSALAAPEQQVNRRR